MVVNILGTILGVVFLIFFGVRALQDFGFRAIPRLSLPFFDVEKIKEELILTPSEKHITVSSWNEEFFVYLLNNSDKTYYDVNILSKLPMGVSLSFLPEDPSGFSNLGTKENNISVGADFMISYKDRVGAKNITQTIINNIGPNEKKKIKVFVNKNNLGEDFDLKFQISDFSVDPKSILKSNK